MVLDLFFLLLLTVSDCKNDDHMLTVPLGRCNSEDNEGQPSKLP